MNALSDDQVEYLRIFQPWTNGELPSDKNKYEYLLDELIEESLYFKEKNMDTELPVSIVNYMMKANAT